MLTAATYFDARRAPPSARSATLADALYARVDWHWAQNGGATVTHGWRPESGFLPLPLARLRRGAAPVRARPRLADAPAAAESYRAWTRDLPVENRLRHDYLYAGPLFTHQLSHVWIDFRGIQDAFMREHGIDYFENSRRATLRAAAVRHPQPARLRGLRRVLLGDHRERRSGRDDARGRRRRAAVLRLPARAACPYGPDDGTIAPWAVVASLPFAPEIVLPTIAALPAAHLADDHPYGFKATFNPTFPDPVAVRTRLGVALALRHQPGADRGDDRELPIGTGVATDSWMSRHRGRTASRGIHRRVAVERTWGARPGRSR